MLSTKKVINIVNKIYNTDLKESDLYIDNPSTAKDYNSICFNINRNIKLQRNNDKIVVVQKSNKDFEIKIIAEFATKKGRDHKGIQSFKFRNNIEFKSQLIEKAKEFVSDKFILLKHLIKVKNADLTIVFKRSRYTFKSNITIKNGIFFTKIVDIKEQVDLKIKINSEYNSTVFDDKTFILKLNDENAIETDFNKFYEDYAENIGVGVNLNDKESIKNAVAVFEMMTI